MANINMSSILDKAKKYTRSETFQNAVENKIDQAMLNGTPLGGKTTIYGTKEAAEKFIEVLKAEIENCAGADVAAGQLGATAVRALLNLEYGTPVKIGQNRYQIGVSFANNLSRDSLAPDEYPEGIENIAALLNKGYDAKNTVYGIWYGRTSYNIPSLQNRAGAHFIENAIRKYMDGYAKEYGVIDIQVDDVYT